MSLSLSATVYFLRFLNHGEVSVQTGVQSDCVQMYIIPAALYKLHSDSDSGLDHF